MIILSEILRVPIYNHFSTYIVHVYIVHVISITIYIYISGQITLILTSSPSCLNLFPMITVLVLRLYLVNSKEESSLWAFFPGSNPKEKTFQLPKSFFPRSTVSCRDF